MFNAGDKVIIKKDAPRYYIQGLSFNRDMGQYTGKTYTILGPYEKRSDWYKLQGIPFVWAEEWLEEDNPIRISETEIQSLFEVEK